MLLAYVGLGLMASSQKAFVACYYFVRLPVLLALVGLTLMALSQKALTIKEGV